MAEGSSVSCLLNQTHKPSSPSPVWLLGLSPHFPHTPSHLASWATQWSQSLMILDASFSLLPYPFSLLGSLPFFELGNSYSTFSAQTKHFEKNKSIPESFQLVVGLATTSSAVMLPWWNKQFHSLSTLVKNFNETKTISLCNHTQREIHTKTLCDHKNDQTLHP